MSTPIKVASFPFPSLFDSESDALMVISECIAERGASTFPAEDLDEIVAGENILEHSHFLFGGDEIETFFFRDLRFWESIFKEIMVDSDEDDFGASPAKLARRDRLLGLLGSVLTAYPAALKERSVFGECAGEYVTAATASVELLRLYRLYTRAVCEAAKEVWPNVDLQALFDQP